MQILTATPADRNKWDAYVGSHPGATAYHFFAWGQSISQVYGHKPYYLIAIDEDEVVGVLPLIHIQLSKFINKLVALPFCDVGNCLGQNATIEFELLDRAIIICKKLKINNLQLRGQLQFSKNDHIALNPINRDKVRMLLAITGTPDELLAGFKSKLRSQIRKSEKNGLIFHWAGEEGVDSFFNVFSINMRDLGSPVHSKDFFKAIMGNYGDLARIGLVEYEGKCVGAGLILSSGKQISIPWASTLRKYNKLAPNMLLYWNCLKYTAEVNVSAFDFGRSTENEGTFQFKKQWGATPTPLAWYNYPPFEMQSENSASTFSPRDVAASVWMRMPITLANCLGPKLRKYIDL
jgi:FemAB-related protein (PEP-CTERM system-associated)